MNDGLDSAAYLLPCRAMGLLNTLRRIFNRRQSAIEPVEMNDASRRLSPIVTEPQAKVVRIDVSAFDRAEADRVVSMRLAPSPPPLPPPAKAYALYSQGDGQYDIDDGGDLVGHLGKEDGDEEHATVWGVNLKGVGYGFRTFKAAKEWLGNPPSKRYR